VLLDLENSDWSGAGSGNLSLATPTDNVGIGMDNSEAKLQVAGDTLLLADKNVDGPTSTYFVSTKRYHVERTKAFEGTTVPLDMTIANNLCMDGRQLHRQHRHEGLD
jgi:hypothetical protein